MLLSQSQRGVEVREDVLVQPLGHPPGVPHDAGPAVGEEPPAGEANPLPLHAGKVAIHRGTGTGVVDPVRAPRVAAEVVPIVNPGIVGSVQVGAASLPGNPVTWR